MPALRLFRRRWLIAEDDVPVPAFLMALFHLVWIIPLIIWYILSNTSGTNCSAKRKYTGAVSGLFIMFCCSFVLEVAALWIGLRGTMFERSKRRPLPTLVYLDLVSHLLQIGFNAYATWANLTDKFECILQYDGWNGSLFMWFITIVTWVYMALFLLFLFIFFNPRSDYTRPESWEGRYMFITWMGAMCCCWNPFSAKQRQRQRERARRVGANLCSMFGHVDLTVTDALAAFALARNMYVQERKRRKMATSDVSKDASGAVKVTKHGGAPVGTELAGGLAFPGDEFTAPKQQEASKDGDSMGMDDAAVPGIRMRMHHSIKYNAATLQSASMGATIAEANHFFKFAFAAYGWMLYLLDGGIVGPLLQLCTGWGARGQYGALGPCCSGKVNKEVALKVLDASPAELLFLREEGALVDVLSYLIAVDHDTKSIVFSIRGALSLSDNVRDLDFESADLDEWLTAAVSWTVRPPEIKSSRHNSKYMAQANYLEAARATLTDLLEQGVLQAALVGADAQYPGYRLVVTGHSLGAACAFLASLYLRQLLPDLCCWCFSPPQGLASATLGTQCKEWCTSTVCGKELPPRYAVTTLDRARDELILAAGRCRRTKWYILIRWLVGGDIHDEDFMLPDDVATPEEVVDVLDAYFEGLQVDTHRDALLRTAGKFGLPGAVLYLEPTGKEVHMARYCCCSAVCCCGSCCSETVRTYRPVWVDAQAMADEGLLLSGRVLSDHMPDYCSKVLARLAKEMGE